MTEKTIQDKIIKRLKKLKAKYTKVVVATTNGEPDIIACYKGRYFGIEVKAVGKKARGDQISKIKEIRRAGGVAFVLDTPELLEELLNTKSVDEFAPINFKDFKEII